MLAKLHRAGELTAIWIPDAAHEAMRDLVRARATAGRVVAKARQPFGSSPDRPLANITSSMFGYCLADRLCPRPVISKAHQVTSDYTGMSAGPGAIVNTISC